MPRSLLFRLSTALTLSLIAATHLRADDAIARVGDTEVTAGEIRTAIQNLDANTQAAAAKDPAALSQVVRAILTQRLILKEALDKRWDQDPAVTAALARVRDGVIAQSYLESVSKPADTYPSDADVQAAYDANKAQLLVPRQFELAQIFVKNPKGADDAATAKAQVKLDGIRKALAKRSADFAAIARAESDEAESAAKGGELGWLAQNRIQPEIQQQLGSLAKGTVTEPIRLDDGWHILKIIDIKEPYTPELSEIKQQLIARMRQEKARQNSQAYVAKLVEQNPIQINELSLSKILKSE